MTDCSGGVSASFSRSSAKQLRPVAHHRFNSASTLDDVIRQYNLHFQFQISAQERDDLIAFLETL